jgi:hypothetical protein
VSDSVVLKDFTLRSVFTAYPRLVKVLSVKFAARVRSAGRNIKRSGELEYTKMANVSVPDSGNTGFGREV